MAIVGWQYFKDIVIQDDNVDSDLTNFPLLISFDNDADIGSRARSDGYDLRFTISPHNDSALLSYEREYFDITGGLATGRIWVKIPSILASSGATIRCWYGKSDASDGEDAENVWDSNFVGVWHMGDLTTSTIEDSTVNGNDGDKFAANEPIEAMGKIDQAQDFDGSDDYVGIGNPSVLQNLNDGTLELWFNRQSTNATLQMMFTDLGSTLEFCFRANVIRFYLNNTTTADYSYSTLDTWVHLAGRWSISGNYQKLYFNGVEVETRAPTGNTGSWNRYMGARGESVPYPFNGLIDEVRISNIARSAEWIKFEYYNMNEADNELTWGGEREITWQIQAAYHINSPVVFVSVAFNSGTRYYSNVYVETATQLYKGNILNLPEIASSVGDVARTYERNKIRILFNDSDYEFRGLEESETVSFKNRTVIIKVGFAEDSYASLSTLFTGFVYDWQRLDNLQYEFDIEERSFNLENEYPDKRVDLTDYANAAPSALKSAAVGWVIPVPYGTISANGLSGDGAFGHPSLSAESSGTGLLFVDTTLNAEKHLVGLQTAAITVDRVYKNGVLQTVGVGNDYQITTQVIDSQTHTLIAWESGNNPTEADFISSDITFGSRKPVEAIRHFLESFCGYTYATDFNSTNYTKATTVETNRAYTFDGALFKKMPLRSILDVWRDEFELDIYWDKDGLLCFKYLTSEISSSPNSYTAERDILAGFDSDPLVYKLLNKLVYGYNYHYAKTYFYNYATRQDTASQTKYGATFEDFKGFEWIRSATMASDIASRKIIRQKDPITFDAYKFPLKTFSDDLADTLKITHFEGIGSSGYSNRYFQVRKTSLDINNYVNSVLLEDTSSFTGKSCLLGDTAVQAATWPGISDSDSQYCYLCNEPTGVFSDGTEGKRLFD